VSPVTLKGIPGTSFSFVSRATQSQGYQYQLLTQRLLVTAPPHNPVAVASDVQASPETSAAPIDRRDFHTSANNESSSTALERAPTSRPPQRRTKQQRLLRVWVPVLGKTVDVYHQRALGAWTVSFRPYSIRDYNATIFRFAREGNIAGMQQVFTAGEASLYDRDSHGWTLLHVSTTGGPCTWAILTL
jgi:hypothetical protein